MMRNKRVIVTKFFHGLCGMQVCAVKDATDGEILEVCNKENPSGTTNGWGIVLRYTDDKDKEKCLPVKCEDDENRLHVIVYC